MYRYVYHQVGTIEDAEDVTSTTFSSALANFDRYTPDRGTPAAWLFGIARNCLRDHHRRHRAHERLIPQIPDREPLPEVQILAAERAASLQRAIQQLPPDQRDAITLRIFGGLRTADIGAVLGKSDAAVKMLIHRALTALRERSKREDWR